MNYLFAAYAVFWGLTFLFVLNSTARLRRLEREIEALRQALESEEGQRVEGLASKVKES